MISLPAKITLTLGSLLVLGGCTSNVPEYQYQCDDGHQFAACFEQEKARITVDGARELELKQVRSASGVRYLSDDQMLVLHTKGDEAILIVNEISQSTCRITK
ncbi:MliC family protein [Vibrio campbellii]|uniref:MliC family protein n=1 Tax=Vibrio campbellii TaxID=680 RepID=UPI0006806336|nr:MliC family protein [Vibrio campbellii]